MLTQSEREWLEHRDAMQFLTGTYIADFAEFPLWNNSKDWQEAAEFSECVAAKLAAVFREIAHVFGDDNMPLPCKYCPANACCKLSDGCDDGILKWARLAVEEEMNADR